MGSLVRDRPGTVRERKCHYHNRSAKTSIRAGGAIVRRALTRRKLMIVGRRVRDVPLIKTRVLEARTCVGMLLAVLGVEMPHLAFVGGY